MVAAQLRPSLSLASNLMRSPLAFGLPVGRLLHVKRVEQTACRVEDTVIRQQGVILGRDVTAARLE